MIYYVIIDILSLILGFCLSHAIQAWRKKKENRTKNSSGILFIDSNPENNRRVYIEFDDSPESQKFGPTVTFDVRYINSSAT